MFRVLLTFVIFCGFALSSFAQQQGTCLTESGVLRSKEKPPIYITFERMSEKEDKATKLIARDESRARSKHSSLPSDRSEQNVGLRLHNNTSWAISFPTDSLYLYPKVAGFRLCNGRNILALSEGIEVNTQYEVEAQKGTETVRTANGIEQQPIVAEAPVIRRVDVGSTVWLAPGKSVIFSVERSHLAKHLMIYVPFVYEWETTNRGYFTSDLEHRVYFRSNELPEGIRK